MPFCTRNVKGEQKFEWSNGADVPIELYIEKRANSCTSIFYTGAKLLPSVYN